jgi:hypothetical protein
MRLFSLVFGRFLISSFMARGSHIRAGSRLSLERQSKWTAAKPAPMLDSKLRFFFICYAATMTMTERRMSVGLTTVGSPCSILATVQAFPPAIPENSKGRLLFESS